MKKEWNFTKLNHDIKVIVEEKEGREGYTITMKTAGITANVSVARHPKYGWYYIVSDPGMYKELGFPKRLNMLHGTAQEVYEFGKEIEKHQTEERNMSLDQKIAGIKAGKENIKTYHYSGSILDGNIPENEESENILRELGLCHDVEGWGVRVEEQLIWKLGNKFSYEDLMKTTAEKRAKDAERNAAKQEKKSRRRQKRKQPSPRQRGQGNRRKSPAGMRK